MNVRSLLFLLFICCLFQSVFSQTVIQATPNGNTYKLSLYPEPPPPVKTIGASGQPAWMYFWEFGDGHYSKEKTPSHPFAKTGDLSVKLSLTPAYSQDRPRHFTETIAVAQKGTPSTNAYPKLGRNAYIRITTNNNELVMREELQMVIHYSPPPGHRSGFVVFAFNEKVNITRSFKYIDDRRYYGESQVEDIYEASEVMNNPQSVGLLDDQAGKFKDVYAFKYQDKDPGKSYRLFVTLRVETPKIGSEISLKTFFVPLAGTLPSKGVSDEETMMIYASHDPNRISVAPRVIEFPKGIDSTLKYKVIFQNKGEGKANEINVRVNKSKSMNVESLKIQGAKIAGEPCPICATTNIPQASCMDTVISEKYIDFVFKNIELLGTKGGETRDVEQTKGEILFSMKPKIVMKKKRVRMPEADAIVIGGAIKFNTEEDTIFTNKIDTQFRRRALAVKVGYNLSSPINELIENNNLYDASFNLLLSVSYTDNPIHKGLAWESELAYSSFRYTRQKTQIYVPENGKVINKTETLKTDLRLYLKYLDVLGQTRFHFTDNIGLGLGAGFSTLLVGSGQIEAILIKAASSDTIRSNPDLKFGLLHAGAEELEMKFASGEEFDPGVPNTPGSYLAMVLFADLGIGKVNKGPLLGFRYGSRFQNGLFDFSFARQYYLQLYLQWKF